MTVSNSKVLLVEDSKFLRMAAEHSLSKAGYLVSTAADGEEALKVAKEKLPDIILLDMMLSKISGPNVLKALKENHATMPIPVIVLTSRIAQERGKTHPRRYGRLLRKVRSGARPELRSPDDHGRDGARPQVDQKAPDRRLRWRTAGRSRPARRAHDSGDRLKR
jgi:CheY-like chemotaxis protein